LPNDNQINLINQLNQFNKDTKHFEKEIDRYLNRLESDNQFIHQKAINYLI